MAETAEDYFQDILMAKEDNTPAKESATTTTSKIDPLKSKNLLKHTNVKIVSKILKNMKNRKAAGPNRIPNEPFKIRAKIITPLLTQLFNLTLSNLKSPKDWNASNL